MWGIKLKGFIRQVDLSYSQVFDDDGEEGKEDNVKYDKDKRQGQFIISISCGVSNSKVLEDKLI